MLKKLCAFVAFIAFFAFVALSWTWAIDSQVNFEYWNLSFYSPSRSYQVKVEEKEEIGTNYFEYIRTDRFRLHDNTFHVGYTGRYEWLGWDLKGGLTPQAGILYRQMGDLTLYLPSPGYRVEPFVRGLIRRYTPARVTQSEAGLRWTPAKGWDVTSRWGNSRTHLLGPNSDRKSADTSSYQLGYSWPTGLRAYAFQGAWKEFFDSGNPANPGEFSSKERGGGFWWVLSADLQLGGFYAKEQRSNETLIKKYGVSLRQVY